MIELFKPVKHISALFLVIASIGVFCSQIEAAERVSERYIKRFWKKASLLDNDTQSRLAGQEGFFRDLFKRPADYNRASSRKKEEMINEWIAKLNKGNSSAATEAAAYLGIVKAKEAAVHIEAVLNSDRGRGRLCWICARSLGQIGNESSIPVLVGLLEGIQQDARIYARAGLAEITGQYLGPRVKDWENYLKEKNIPLCSSTECKLPEENKEKRKENYSSERPIFQLYDTYGRIINSTDYKGVPMLIMAGSCWCGGCQQDAEPLRKIAEKFEPKGLMTIRCVAGDNELASLDFQKHYRLKFPQILDTNRKFEMQHNKKGWTFLMLTDNQGKVVYKTNSPDWDKVEKALEDIIAKPLSLETKELDGVIYLTKTVERNAELEKPRICERFPSVACDAKGRIYVIYTVDCGKSSDVFLRFFDGTKWSEDIAIAATEADEYDATVLVDKQNRVWVCWTSNAGGENYDIFITSFNEPAQDKIPVRITSSDDDAMHGRIACDKFGRIWVTYYKWQKMGSRSRDKEVYLRKYENKQWSEEVQISPTDVPDCEDHTDPAICAYRSGVVIGWSWDYHPSIVKGYSSSADTPTIFMRTATGQMNLSKISGVSCGDIDAMPAIAVANDDKIWCAWESINRRRQKSVCIENCRIGRNAVLKDIDNLSYSNQNVCTPTFAVSSTGQVTALWCQAKERDSWILCRSDLNEDQVSWSAPETIVSNGNPRFCSASYNENGKLWVAYSSQTNNGRKVVVKKF